MLLGHGSTLNPDSSAPVLRLADRIRETGLFREVVCAFWKEQPSFTDFWHMLDSEEIFLVPVFISEGYFCQQVLPRELELDGPLTFRDGAVIHYCRPVGAHPAMRDLLLKRAEEIAPDAPRDETALIIVGHGTSLNDNSKAIIQEQADLIRKSGAGFREVRDAYMEEEPLIADWDKMTSCPNVIVTPFFISDGLHSYQDIPVLLGLEAEPTEAASQRTVFRDNPKSIRGRNLFYSGAIGTDPGMLEVVLSQVADAAATTPNARLSPPAPEGAHRLDQYLLETLRGKDHTVLDQLCICPLQDGGWRLGHNRDLTALMNQDPSLHLVSSLEELRQIVFFNAEAAYRPLKSSPDLRSGWQAEFQTISELRIWLEEAQPAQLGLWADHTHMDVVPLRSMLKRQTGMYGSARRISPEGARELIDHGPCARGNCTRQILWPVEVEEEPPPASPQAACPDHEARGQEIEPWVCREACAILLGAARETARAEHHSKEDKSGEHTHGHHHH